MQPKLAEVKTLYESNARQIPEMMRKLASEIECPPVDGARPDQVLVIVRDSKTGHQNAYAWGDTNIETSTMMMVIQQQRLANIADAGDLWAIPHGGTAPKE
jgi:hypothetical protein